MDISKINKLNSIVLEKVKHLLPDFSKYMAGNGTEAFSKFYYGVPEVEFIQVAFYDRTSPDRRYSNERILLSLEASEGEKLFEDLKAYSKALEDAQLEISGYIFDSDYKRKEYLSLSHANWDFGICSLDSFKRCKAREEREEVEAELKHQERLLKDASYRGETEWFEEQFRPFGGAYNSLEEYLLK